MAGRGVGRILGAGFGLWLAVVPAARSQEAADAAADEAYFRALPVYKILVDRSGPRDGFEMAFRVAGREGRPVMVLFHGISDTGFSYAGLARRLDNDFRMIIVDLPAYGDTFTAKPLDFSYASQTSRLRALLEAVGALNGAVFVGHSTGGGLAWHLSLEPGVHPAGLVLIDAITVEYGLPARTRLAYILAKHHSFSGPIFNLIGPGTIARIIARESAAPGFRLSETSRLLQSALFTTPARLRVNALWASQLLDFKTVKAWAPRLREISVPTLLLWGEDDAVLKLRFMEEAQKQIPGAQSAVIRRAGHSPHIEKPAETADRIRTFAAGLAAPAGAPTPGSQVRVAAPGEIAKRPQELRGSMVHLTFSVSRYGKSGIADAAGIHLKRGYYSTDYPSQSGSAGLFLEGLHWDGGRPLFAGYQVELVWYKAGGFRFAQGWSVAGGRKTASLIKLGYVPSYVPWVCLGVRWIGPRAKAGFFVTLELAPLLDKVFLFW